jgi:hypothetical protein
MPARKVNIAIGRRFSSNVEHPNLSALIRRGCSLR